MTYELAGTGIWATALRFGDPGEAAESAAEIEELGYSAAWLPDAGGDIFGSMRNLLDATHSITVASGILNVWMHEPAEIATGYQDLVADYPARVLVGIGVSHAPLIDEMTQPGTFGRPLAKMTDFLDAVDAATTPIPADARVLGALGPKMLGLARTRAGGAHPYLVTPEHTAQARAALGDGKLLAPMQLALLEIDPGRAREVARKNLAYCLGLPNYVNNWRRCGFSDADVAAPGSDRLVDALVAWGDEQAILDRVQQHRDAGADHVCIQAITERNDMTEFPRAQWRELAAALA